MIEKKIKFFDSYDPYKKINISYKPRSISVYKFDNIKLNGLKLNYPLPLLESNEEYILPIREKFMSLSRGTIYEKNMKFKGEKFRINKIYNKDLFFFIYNTANYYHFLYDCLPHLISFKYLKKNLKNLKLLTYPPLEKNDNMLFFYQTLKLLNINKKDLIKADFHTLYKSIFISDSFTHAGKSNHPPHPDIYKLYASISTSSNFKKNNYEKIYISRRTWIKEKKNNANIGTDYTIRRKCVNEDEVFKLFKNFGFKEIFTEDLNMKEKIKLFKNAKYVAGTIGGGMANVIFCKPNTTVISINSPDFFTVNKRFKYSLIHTNLINFNITSFVENNIKKKDQGKNAISIEGGINSPWIVDIKKLHIRMKSILK